MSLSNVCACVTAFHPDAQFSTRVDAIASQVAHVIVVDNGEGNGLDDLVPSEKVELIANGNKGAVAGALNIAISRARLLGFEFLITFDQDSTVSEDLVDHLVESCRNSGAGIAGPNYRNSATNAPGRFNLFGRGLLISKWFASPSGIHEVYCVITSGMLVDLRSLPGDLGYREEFAVDFVDVEFCLRARARGIRIVVDTDVSMVHSLGNRVPGSSRFSPTNYGPSRRYLASRNRVVLWSEYFRKFPIFVLNDVLMAVGDVIRTLLFENQRWRLAKAFMGGFRDGINAVMSRART